MGLDGSQEFIPPNSDLYVPTGDFKTDAANLATVVVPFRELNEQRERELVEQQRQRLEKTNQVRESVAKAFQQLPRSGVVKLEQDDGSFVLVANYGEQMWLVRSRNGKARMSGYLPDFDEHMIGFEIITNDRSLDSPLQVNTFDVSALQRGEGFKWGNAKIIDLADKPLLESRKTPAQTHTIEQLTEVAPLTAQLPQVLEAYAAQQQ